MRIIKLCIAQLLIAIYYITGVAHCAGYSDEMNVVKSIKKWAIK